MQPPHLHFHVFGCPCSCLSYIYIYVCCLLYHGLIEFFALQGLAHLVTNSPEQRLDTAPGQSASAAPPEYRGEVQARTCQLSRKNWTTTNRLNKCNAWRSVREQRVGEEGHTNWSQRGNGEPMPEKEWTAAASHIKKSRTRTSIPLFVFALPRLD